MPYAIVIGGGFGGMAAALRLRARGYDVTLLEKLGQLGGRAGVFRRNGYVFDAGPTVITAPFLFDELFELFGKQREDYVRFAPLSPWYRVVFADGSHFDYGGTIEQTLEQIRRIEPADADGYLRFLAHSKRIFEVGFVQLGDQPFLTPWSMIKAAPQMVRLGAWRTVWQMACKYIRNEKLRRVFSFQPLLVGGNPFTTTSIYALIHYLERQWGVWFAMGGTGALVDGLRRLMEEAGVDVRLEAEVKQIDVDPNHRCRGVIMGDGTRLAADVVVCNGDAPFAYQRLIAPEHRRRWTDQRIGKLRYSMGLFVLYFGTTRQYPQVAHHTIMLGERYRELLHDMFELKKLAMDDFSVYVHRPTHTDPSLAPAGCDSFYVLCPVPNLQAGVDWTQMGPRYRDLIVGYLEERLLPDLSRHIVEDFFVTPRHFLENLNTLHGTGFSIQPTFGQSAWFRFHNRSEGHRGPVHGGCGDASGCGVAGCAVFGKCVGEAGASSERTPLTLTPALSLRGRGRRLRGLGGSKRGSQLIALLDQ